MKECALLLVETIISLLQIVSATNARPIVKRATEKAHVKPAKPALSLTQSTAASVPLKQLSCIRALVSLNAQPDIILIQTEEFASNVHSDARHA
jgi:hypothetical protein